MLYEVITIRYAGTNAKLVASCYSRFATEYFNMEDYENSLKMDKKSLYYNSLINEKQSIGFDLHNIGLTFEKLEQEDSAQYYFSKSLEMVDSTNILYAYNHDEIGASLIKKGFVITSYSIHYTKLYDYTT